ncbi:NSUN6 family protein [Megaselia abdita]
MYYPKSPFVKCRAVESQLFRRNLPHFEDFLQWLCETPKITTYRVNHLETTTENFANKVRSSSQSFQCTVTTDPNLPEVVFLSKGKKLAKHDPTLKEVIVDKSCGAALLRGAHLYAPGVLAMQSGTKQDEVVNVFADLEGKCKKGTTTEYLSDQKTFIGIGQVKQQRYQIYGDGLDPKGVAVEMVSTVSGVPSIGDLSSTEALLQNLPSIVCVHVLDPKPKEIILDMCSAPGNKTTHIAELMGNQGTIIALDKTESKIQLIKNKVQNYGFDSIKPFAFDSTKSFDETLIRKSALEGPPFGRNTFDRILLDAPCSALGNRPVLADSLTPKMLSSYPVVQKKLFCNAVELLKVGGVLVFSTCTIVEDENEGMVKWALDKFPNLKLVDATPFYGGEGVEGCDLSDEERKKVQRFGIKNRVEDVDSVGFFISKFIKVE